MELPNYIPTRLPSYELPRCRFNRYHRNHSQPCVLPANHETHSMSQREALTVQSPLFRNTHADGSPQYKQDLVAGALTANAPPPQGRTRPDALVTLAGYARRRREIWRNPSRLGEGVAPQKWCAMKRSRNADALPYGKRAHPRKIHLCLDDLSDSRSETHVDRMRSNGDGYQLRTVWAEDKARRELAAGPFVGEHCDFPLELFYRADEVAGRDRR